MTTSILPMPQIRSNLKRAASEELGEGDWATKYSRHGRPIRKSAGKKSPDPAYVNVQVIEEELSDFEDGGPLSEEDTSEDELEERTPPPSRKRPAKKQKRAPSPTPPPLSPPPPEDLPSPRSSPQPGHLILGPAQRADFEPINLTFNIPVGFSGPLHLQLDLSNVPLRQNFAPVKTDELHVAPTPIKVVSLATDENAKGFLSFPPELRNKVYRFLFKDEKKFDFSQPDNFKCTSAFLRSCRQVYEEGRTILYGENQFYFERNKDMRRPFWAGERKEIGYKDLRLFLRLIGPTNTSYIRQIWICFDDAMPSATPHLKRAEERRYVYDGHLIECLHVLARDSRLKKITLAFWGRKHLAKTDMRFLEKLCNIKADEVEFKSPFQNPYWHPERIFPEVKTNIKKEMTRKVKMYNNEK
ncbi:hypothetical protein EJ08DRAFT_654604 [Tothia fuscella]|uniref:Uncharacterized protein n=1 Tax=Tothia fuscella TaxID=1048955 RepID=A0A9P4TSQ5_9PEZI|nr:hypothetical protein EJ08DRAFT_654604 [Tothia fuscella]